MSAFVKNLNKRLAFEQRGNLTFAVMYQFAWDQWVPYMRVNVDRLKGDFQLPEKCRVSNVELMEVGVK